MPSLAPSGKIEPGLYRTLQKVYLFPQEEYVDYETGKKTVRPRYDRQEENPIESDQTVLVVGVERERSGSETWHYKVLHEEKISYLIFHFARVHNYLEKA